MSILPEASRLDCESLSLHLVSDQQKWRTQRLAALSRGRPLPIRLTTYAKPFCENIAIRLARIYEQATERGARRLDFSWLESTRMAAGASLVEIKT